ncbi:MAG: lipopolysaccharide biosynthesis protein [Myxococcales bacterium]
MAIAKMYFLVIGLVQQVLLTRVLGTGGYGAISTALSVSAVVYNPIVTTSIQGVSRTVARSEEHERPHAIRKAFKIHAGIALPIAIAFGTLAGPIVESIHAPHLLWPVRALALVLFFYGVYAPLIGVLNGQRRFVWQAGFDICFATLRTVLMLGGALLLERVAQRGVLGASAGFALASATIFCAAVLIAKTGSPGRSRLATAEYLAFIGPVFAGQVLLNLLQQADLTLLRYYAASAAIREQLAPESADVLVGAYRAAQLFCFLPYQLLLSITFVLFPLLAKAHSDGKVEDVKLFVMTGVRLALLIAGMMVSVISGLSGPLLRLVFPADVATHATHAMQLLALGFGAFAIFGILTTVLTSLKAERASALITGGAFAMVAGLGYALLRTESYGSHQLLRTAMATSIGLVVATLAAAARVRRLAGGVVLPLTLIRVLLASAITIAVSRFFEPTGKIATIGFAALLAALNVTILAVSRELTVRDVRHVRSVFLKRANGH